MTSPTWLRVFEVFERCVELPEEQRQAFLDDACDDAPMRQMVEELLAADSQDGDTIIERPLFERPAKSWSGDGAQPETLGAYRIQRQVGQGGMSTVYLAVRADDAFRRHVAVKLVRRGMESEPMLRRLRIERQILASLDHPYIAKLYDGGSSEEGLPYFVMEYVEGTSIDRYCEDNGLGLKQRLQLFRKVCDAVHYAHQNLVIHRDIKPSNILVTANGDPKLLDFGIARLLNPDLTSAEVEPTVTWQRILTPSYASPEQIRGRQVTTGSDVYSLGVLLYQLLTGRLPRVFKGRTASEIERLLAETEPTPPSTASRMPVDPDNEEIRPLYLPDGSKALHKQLVGDLDAIVLKALRTAPAQRYGSVDQLDSDLDSYLSGHPVSARAGTWRYRASKFVRRNRAAMSVVAAIAILLIGVAGAMVARSAQVARERDQARLERDKKDEVLKLVFDVFRYSNPYVLPGEELSVREALALSVPVLETGLRGQPDVRAELLHTSGTILDILGEYRPAELQLQEAYDLRSRLYADDHPAVIESLTALAGVRRELGQLDEAEVFAQQAVELAQAYEEAKPQVLVNALHELVEVRCYQSQHRAAEDPAQEALLLARQLPEDEQEADALEALAAIASAVGDYEAAAGRYRQALAMRRQRFGEYHPVLVNTLSNLGQALRRNEDFAAAERTYQELIELQRRSFGEDYRDPFTLGNLAGLRFGQGDYAATIEIYGQARDAVLESSGEDHWMIFLIDLAVADAHIQDGRPAKAENDLRRVLERFRPIMGDDHWRMSQGESLLGASLSAQGQCEAAEVLLTNSFERLLEAGKARHRSDALERLRRHLERCERSQEFAAFEAMMPRERADATP